jgi:hypothetical protein
MPAPLGRRRALGALAAGAAGVLTARPRWSAAAPAPRDLEALAQRIRAKPRAGAFALATELIRAGADVPALLGGIFLCGVREIRPRPHGILHSVMMVGSSFQLCEGASPTEAWLLALWNLDSLKESMEDDDREWGNWSLAPPRPARVAGHEAARKELVAAMEAWDAPRADAAVTALLPHSDRAALFEVLWPFLARCYAFIGHKIIYAMQVERVLGRIGWAYAEPALRSLVMASLVNRDTAAHDQSRELLPTLPAAWERGREDPAGSAALLGALRAAKPREAQALVARAFRDGLGPQTVWDALRLLGAEIFMKRSGRTADTGRLALLPVHALTVANAFGHAARSAREDATRRLMVLQAAGWLTAMRDDLAGLAGLSMDGPGIEAREPGETPAPDRARELARLRAALARKAQENHQHKLTAAVEEESGRVHPRWAGRIVATGADYVDSPKDPETELYRRSVRALRDAGQAV